MSRRFRGPQLRQPMAGLAVNGDVFRRWQPQLVAPETDLLNAAVEQVNGMLNLATIAQKKIPFLVFARQPELAMAGRQQLNAVVFRVLDENIAELAAASLDAADINRGSALVEPIELPGAQPRHHGRARSVRQQAGRAL